MGDAGDYPSWVWVKAKHPEVFVCVFVCVVMGLGCGKIVKGIRDFRLVALTPEDWRALHKNLESLNDTNRNLVNY